MKRTKILAVSIAVILLFATLSTMVFAEKAENNYPYTKDGKIDLSGYFTLEGAKITVEEEAVLFTMTADTAKIVFNKPLAADGFNLAWNAVNDGKQRLDKMTITVSDMQNEKSAIDLIYEKLSDSKTVFRLNASGVANLINGSMFRENNRDFKLTYSASEMLVTDGNAIAAEVKQNTHADAFNGFDSLAVNMTITLSGEKGASFKLTTLNMQRLGTKYLDDNVEPMLCIPSFSAKQIYNSEVTLPQVAAYDVLAENVTIRMTVQAPSGETVKAVDGTLLEDVDGRGTYKIKMSEWGIYRISYVLSDGKNTTMPMGYQLSVADDGAPQLVLKQTIPVLTAGESYTFPEYTVEDNSGSECISWITVEHPDGTMSVEEGSFVPQEAGIYCFTFTAMDENGNVTRITVKTYAKEES